MVEKWFFGFRVLGPAGAWIACGPHRSYDDALRDRENMKASDAEVTQPFIAEDVDDAKALLAGGDTTR